MVGSRSPSLFSNRVKSCLTKAPDITECCLLVSVDDNMIYQVTKKKTCDKTASLWVQNRLDLHGLCKKSLCHTSYKHHSYSEPATAVAYNEQRDPGAGKPHEMGR